MTQTTTTKNPTLPDPELIVGEGVPKDPEIGFSNYLGNNDFFFFKNIYRRKIFYIKFSTKNILIISFYSFEIREGTALQGLSQRRKLVLLTARM